MNEKELRYFTRTLDHIHRVHRNMLTIVTSGIIPLTVSKKAKLMKQVLNHDRSKFSEIQCEPYIELTEYYYQRKNLGNNEYQYAAKTKQLVDRAVLDHYHKENHHPESRGGVDSMPMDDLLEVICDLQAMAQEFNEGSCRSYFQNVWCKKYSPSEEVAGFMNMVISVFEE